MSVIPFDLVLESYPTELCEIMDKYGSDKSPTRNWHSYTPIYHCLFQKKRRGAIRLLEIGLGFRELMDFGGHQYTNGASILGWHDYFPHGEIFGIDVRPESLVQADQVKTYLCDQGSRDMLRELMLDKITGALDIIIDDGSHRPEHQLVSLVTLFPFLQSGGIYIVEDIAETELFRKSPLSRKDRDQFHPLWNRIVHEDEYKNVKRMISKGFECILTNPRYTNNFDDHLLILFKK